MSRRNRELRDGRSEREAYGRGTCRDTSGRLYEFFVDGYGIDFKVLQNEIRKYLGLEARAITYSLNVRKNSVCLSVCNLFF